ncbi:MAG: 3'-5' exonuclease, partial [Geminicoccales bacterium]
ERELAALIARRIFGWLRDRAPLPSADRPIRPGDVMILLPRRGVLQDLLIRELKQLGVPVAGADRLALTDEIAVMDLMALGDALLLPEDDLTLAAVLKSPLFGLSEEELYELAADRGKAGLHDRLFELRDRRASFGEAYARFAQLLAMVDFVPPFEFYTRLLGEGGGRRRMLARLGAAAVEPIEAFLAQALAFEQGHPPSMQAFLHWLRADSTELIRDPDRPRDEVRVLTCHGAKGLEAEIVFLADTTYVPTLKDPLLWLDDAGLPLWKVGRKQRDPVSEAAYERARRRVLQEHRRLLYVAMTRARDWLIVTGCQHRNGRGQTWHELIGAGLERLGAERVTIEGPAGAESLGWRYASHPRVEPLQAALPLVPRKAEPLRPAWLDRPAPPEPPHERPQSPSRLADFEEPTAVSPLLQEAHGLRRGRLIHRLLQSLPGRPREEREAALARYLAQPSLGLDQPLRAAIAAEVLAVLDAPDTAALFEAGSRAEVPIAGIVAGQTIAGQVDRLAVTAREVL